MKIKSTHLFVLVACFLSIFLFSSCTKTKKKQPDLVQQELDRRLSKYRKTLINKCKEKAVSRAVLYTDSIVAELMSTYVGDTLKFPRKPVRPNPPERIKLDDSTVVKPIISN